ncbi:hypothetical protein [Sorangium sp. So ce233]|uniref:hypothetical protein n=1 Tax=Sorangium sp. So ce233 TaxID=3133290 RepID=UPI003F5E7FE6
MWTRREELDPVHPPRTWDCASLCEDMEAKSQAADCTSELDDYMGCLNDQRSVCELDPCGAEAIRHTTCVLSYCLEHREGPCSR